MAAPDDERERRREEAELAACFVAMFMNGEDIPSDLFARVQANVERTRPPMARRRVEPS